MRIFNDYSHSAPAPFELNGGGRFVLSRKDFMPAYVRARSRKALFNSARQRQSKRCVHAAFAHAIVKLTGLTIVCHAEQIEDL